jgi:hypothetical protein
MITDRFVVLKKGEKNSSSIQASAILITFVATSVCKAKAALRIFMKVENEKLMLKLRSRVFFLNSDLKI